MTRHDTTLAIDVTLVLALTMLHSLVNWSMTIICIIVSIGSKVVFWSDLSTIGSCFRFELWFIMKGWSVFPGWSRARSDPPQVDMRVSSNHSWPPVRRYIINIRQKWHFLSVIGNSHQYHDFCVSHVVDFFSTFKNVICILSYHMHYSRYTCLDDQCNAGLLE